MEEIQKEIEAPIEETQATQAVEVEVKPKRVKKPRTQKQIDAFEKARLKRLENIKKKKEASSPPPKPKEEEFPAETTPPSPPNSPREEEIPYKLTIKKKKKKPKKKKIKRKRKSKSNKDDKQIIKN